MKLVIAEKPSVAQSIARVIGAAGRVMTPTLGMAVMREAEIRAFKPEIFYEVELHFSGISAKIDRIKERSDADKAAEICRNEGKAEVISSVCREKTEKPPALYDLTSLQRDANRILGFTAQQTLDYTQSLYEKKLVTYPRTDSRYLTDDMAPALPDRQFAEKCSYIDDYHLKVGNSVYHICQYAEILQQNGGHCEPEPETELAKVAWQLGHKEYLMLERI